LTGGHWFWIAAVSLALAGLFATLNLALRYVSRVSLEELGARRGRRSRLDPIASDLEGHALAISIPRLLFGLMCVLAVAYWVATLRREPQPGWIDLGIAVVAASILLWTFALTVPLSIARHAGPNTILRWWWLIRASHLLATPFRRLGSGIDEIVRRLAGVEPSSGLHALEAELISVVEEHERDGEIDGGARDMIEKVVEFGTTTVEQIMTPRTEVEALEYTDELETVKQFVRGVGHSRIPVYRESLDHVAGVLYAKDLLHWLAAQNGTPDEAFDLSEIIRDATFVPETKTVRELLTELLSHRVHIAMVADEYGGTAGLVTIEDIVEEIFGEIQDEYEPEAERPSVDIDPETLSAELDARKRIDDANDHLEAIGIELPESEDYDTVGGFVVVTLGLIPETGATLRSNGLLVTVLEAEQTRVCRVRIERIREGESEARPDRQPILERSAHAGEHAEHHDEQAPAPESLG